MLDLELRKAIYRLHAEGVSSRQISRQLRVSRNTVKTIIKHRGELPEALRKDQIPVDKELLERLYKACHGRIQRIYEKLNEEEQIKIGYSTLARLISKQGLGRSKNRRCVDGEIYSIPGKEIQHDTSPYRIKIGCKLTRITASLLYFRYSKQRYLKFYRSFPRFQMKCFFYEAHMHFGYTAEICVIDNTNLAVLHGTGSNAVFVPEMISFAKRFGFKWLAHERGHSDRKAGEERSFWYVETNFFLGREFSSMEDLNEQAFHWSTVRIASKPQTKARIIPNEYFAREKESLIKLPPYVGEPYEEHERQTDKYGYIAFMANYYWVPGTKRDKVKVLEFSNRIKLFQYRDCLVEYQLPAFGTRNEKFKPAGAPSTPYQPKHRKQGALVEEKKLRQAVPEIGSYLDFILKHYLRPSQRARFFRSLYALQTKISRPFFIQTIQRAEKYKVINFQSVERIAQQTLRNAMLQIPMEFEVPELESREVYQQGRISHPPDLNAYSVSAESTEDE
jgi:transposase